MATTLETEGATPMVLDSASRRVQAVMQSGGDEPTEGWCDQVEVALTELDEVIAAIRDDLSSERHDAYERRWDYITAQRAERGDPDWMPDDQGELA